MWSFKDHGKSWDAIHEKSKKPGFRWVHHSFGTNWRMMEIQAAIGREQLKLMPEWHSRRIANMEKINDACSEVSWLSFPKLSNENEHAAYKAYAVVQKDRLPEEWSRDRILKEILDMGVPAYSGSCSEIYNEKAFEGTSYKPETPLRNAKALGENSIMFLVHPSLSDEEIAMTCEAIRRLKSVVV
jgi:dTDP-4-amino-4,6-dideoxygalactose transaminase